MTQGAKCVSIGDNFKTMISLLVQKLIEKYKVIKELEEKAKSRPENTVIHVDEVAVRVAALYEKIRKIVDWREEHLMRRVAIKRIIKRRKFISKNDDAEDFVLEIIRGGHFPNDQIEKSKIKDVKKIIGKYSAVLEKSEILIKNKKHLFWNEVLEIASCEIEEVLDPIGHAKVNALIEFMEESIRPKIIIGKKAQRECPLAEEEKKEFIYIAIQQALFNLDEQLIFYNILKRRNNNWHNLERDDAENTLKEIINVLNEYERINVHRLFNKFYAVFERYNTPYLIIGDIIAGNPEKAMSVFSREENLTPAIRRIYEQRLEKLGAKTRRAAVYSTISVFLGNVLSLYVLEIPFTLYIMGNLNVWAQILTIVLPTLLMFLLVVTIKLPSVNNYRLVIEAVKKLAAHEEDVHEVDVYPKKKLFFRILSSLVYFLSIVICFAAYGLFLYTFNYPPFSSFLFIVFTALILFAGIKIRRRARELHVEPKKEGFISILKDLFSMPVIRLGKWLSNYWKKFNIVSITFNLLVELPFLTFINFLEDWRCFLKEKKEDIH